MSKLSDRIIQVLIRKDVSIHAQLFRFMSLLGTIAMALGGVYTLAEGMEIKNVAALFAGALFMGMLFWAGKKFQQYDLCSFILMSGLNGIFLPVTFLRSGGLKSGMPLWFVLGFISLFFLLRGKSLVAGTVITIIADAYCFYTAYVHPERITYMESESVVYVDIIVSAVITIFMTCAFMFIQITLSEYQRKENEKQQAELVAAMNTQSRFLANMSHEIRTPINTIIGLNEMTLREENLSDDIIENANNIQSASKMLLSLINDILDLSKYLFDSFKRVNEGSTKGIEGTGLGLSICSQLVNLMGGQITVDSIYQKGSTFTITIPQKIVNATPLGNLNYNSSSRHQRSSYKKSFEAPEAKVLVVDDNDMNLLVAKKLLRETKVQLALAHSGMECLKLTAKNNYDVIFMDHMMPEMDGEKTMDLVRNQQGGFCRKTPIIALTANAMSGAEEKYRKMGFSDYLAKPINGILFEAMLLRYLPKERIEYMIDPDEISEMDGFRILGQKKKQRLIVSTDNVVDLPNDVIRQLGIPVMHYFVNTEYGHYEDMVEIHSDSLLSYIEKDQYAKSEAPTVGEYETFFGNLLEEAEQVLHISIASESGKGFENASQAAAGFSHVQVFDSGHLSSGTGLMVMHAANMVLKNKDLDEILQSLEAIQPKIQTSFILDSSKQLYRSGLLNKQVWKMTEMLQCHPVLALHKKKIVPAAIFFGNTQDVYKKYIHAQMARWSPIDQKVLFITSAGCSKETKDMILEEVQKYKKFDQIYMQEASAAITSNCGAGCFGLIYMLQ